MGTYAIIAEYNPFHNGHLYQYQCIREMDKDAKIIIIMSGNYVQRGAPAILDKFTRAKMAVTCGADLVLELPVRYATGSAPRFAEGAIRMLNQLEECVDYLVFGSEHASIDDFNLLAELLLNEPESMKTAIKEHLKNGRSFPFARAAAIGEHFQKNGLSLSSRASISEFLKAPNNILGLEYVLALRKTESRIKPLAIKRVKNQYHDKRLTGELSSATSIRHALLEGSQSLELLDSLPPETYSYLGAKSFLKEDDFSLLLGMRLLTESAENLTSYLDVGPDLADRIMRLLFRYQSFSSFADLVTTKNSTRTTVMRALIHILLGIKEDPLKDSFSVKPLLRVLAFKKESILLNEIKKQTEAILITKPVTQAKELYEEDLYASHIYELVKANKEGKAMQHEYEHHLLPL